MRELDIRNALRSHLAAINKKPDTRIIDEVEVCQGLARIDMVVINGSLQGYEIKSEQDTLARLPTQADVYNQIFDTVVIISTKNHLKKIAELVPRWWGIREAVENCDKVSLKVVRKSSPNPNVDPNSIVKLLWKKEALNLLEELGLEKGMKSKPKRALWMKLAENTSSKHLGFYIRETLKSRKDWRSAQ